MGGGGGGAAPFSPKRGRPWFRLLLPYRALAMIGAGYVLFA